MGSVGTQAWAALLLGRDRNDPLFLQCKEAVPSVLAPFVGKSRYDQQGQRVVEGQRLMQASSDIFLGWDRVTGIDGVKRDFYVRQLWDWKTSADVTKMVPEGLQQYGRLCGWTLARAHARSGDRIAIAAYLGDDDMFDRPIGAFAEAYADQNERDYEAFRPPSTAAASWPRRASDRHPGVCTEIGSGTSTSRSWGFDGTHPRADSSLVRARCRRARRLAAPSGRIGPEGGGASLEDPRPDHGDVVVWRFRPPELRDRLDDRFDRAATGVGERIDQPSQPDVEMLVPPLDQAVRVEQDQRPRRGRMPGLQPRTNRLDAERQGSWSPQELRRTARFQHDRREVSSACVREASLLPVDRDAGDRRQWRSRESVDDGVDPGEQLGRPLAGWSERDHRGAELPHRCRGGDASAHHVPDEEPGPTVPERDHVAPIAPGAGPALSYGVPDRDLESVDVDGHRSRQ